MGVVCITCERVWSGVPGQLANALLYSEEGVLGVGDIEEIKGHPLYEGGKKLHLQGRMIVPGLSDSHLHLLAYAKQQLFAQLLGAKSKEEMLSRLAAKAKEVAPTEWVCGYNFNEVPWEDPVMPDRSDLDSLGIPNPVFIQRICTHATVLNSRAMELCGLEDRGCLEGVLKDASGRPNGIVVEDVQAVAHSKMAEDMLGRERMLELLKKCIGECASYGLTTLFVCGAASLGMEENLDLYQELKAAGELNARIFAFIDEKTVPRMATGFGDRWVNYQGFKLFLDGSLGARTAALSEPYSDAPEEMGFSLHEEAELVELLRSLDERHTQALAHTIGDAALDRLLDAYEEAGRGAGNGRRLPLLVNHCMICRPDQIRRMKELGVAATIQPTFVPSDRNMAPPRLGDRVERGWAYPWRSLVDAGILLNGSSDCPIESVNPWDGIRAAVTRKTVAGVWMPEQRLSVEEALRLYTVNPAVNSGSDGWRGTLEPGKEADFAVIDRDILSCGEEEWECARVECTVLAGRVVHGELEGI